MDEIKVDAASDKDWEILEKRTPDATFVSARCVLELRDRVAALEAAADTSAPAAAPAGVTEEELADCLPANAWAGPEGYSRQAFARHLLDHPRIGPLLRGEGAATPKRVVLPDGPPIIADCYDPLYGMGRRDAWAAARAEVERQQQGGQVDG